MVIISPTAIAIKIIRILSRIELTGNDCENKSSATKGSVPYISRILTYCQLVAGCGRIEPTFIYGNSKSIRYEPQN